MSPFSKWTTIGYAAAIFVAGGISGGAIGIYEARSHVPAPPGEQEMAGRMLNRLQARLDLTPDQMAKIRPIIERAAADLRSIRTDTAQRINKTFDDSYAQVSAILTPAQRVKLDDLQKKRREAMQLHFGGHWRAAGPPRHSPGDDDDDHDQSPAPSAP